MGNGWRFGAVALVMLVAACSSIPIGAGSNSRNLDYLNDDVASLLIAFDLPPSLEPAPGASTLNFDVTTPSSGERHIKATLVISDADELAGTLPPPPGERNYYLFGFSDADRTAIREAQALARGQAPGSDTFVLLSLNPGFCRTGPLDPATTVVSALIALPGVPSLRPLVSNMPLGTVLATAKVKNVPSCAGHSG